MRWYMIAPLPNGKFQLVSYSRSEISSITGPVEEVFGFRSLRMILPKEVVIVSTYVTPVMSSFMIRLELTLDIPGASPMDMAPVDTSSIFKQAVTPLKPCGGVEGFTGATTFVDGEVQMEKVLWEDGWEASQVLPGNTGEIFLLVLKPGLPEGFPQQQLPAKMDVIPYPIQRTLQFIPGVVVPVQGVSLGHWWGKGLLNLFFHMPPGHLPPGKPPHW